MLKILWTCIQLSLLFKPLLSFGFPLLHACLFDFCFLSIRSSPESIQIDLNHKYGELSVLIKINLFSIIVEGKINLEWSTRYRILLETAQGLSYLHEESQRILAHGDIKASNILLDKTMRPKIADFGLANLFYYDAGEVKFQDMASV
jgi:serine/threonine protein kinase